MEETLKPRQLQNSGKIADHRYRDIESFSEKVRSRYKALISSSVIKRPSSASESVELIFLIDDLNNVVFDQQVEGLKLDISEMAYTSTLPLKCGTLLASEFWAGFNARDEGTMHLLRESLAVHDNGFFLPIQDLLVTGKIRPSKESVNVYFVKAEHSVKDANHHVARAVVDLYWAVTDAAHAAVMVAGIVPPSPSHLAETVKRELVARNLVHRRCGEIIDRVYDAAKKVMHREVFEVSGRDFDSYLADADFFIKEIDEFVKEHVKDGVKG
ncbi:hypothetical protein JW898_02635 [Candidatus Woesearchaeota archaeon]|nr:hypothetical protein [Candidatus Woesearchaeota archaeon]